MERKEKKVGRETLLLLLLMLLLLLLLNADRRACGSLLGDDGSRRWMGDDVETLFFLLFPPSDRFETSVLFLSEREIERRQKKEREENQAAP